MPPFGIGGTVDSERWCYNNWNGIAPDDWVHILCQRLLLGGQVVYKLCALTLALSWKLLTGCVRTLPQKNPFEFAVGTKLYRYLRQNVSPKAYKPLLITTT